MQAFTRLLEQAASPAWAAGLASRDPRTAQSAARERYQRLKRPAVKVAHRVVLVPETNKRHAHSAVVASMPRQPARAPVSIVLPVKRVELGHLSAFHATPTSSAPRGRPGDAKFAEEAQSPPVTRARVNRVLRGLGPRQGTLIARLAALVLSARAVPLCAHSVTRATNVATAIT